MEKFNSGKLIDHIEEAKDWLDKAEIEYSNSNPVRGGLILNLAQAEVKHAWELSHHQFVSNSVSQPKPNYKFKYVIPIAASLVLLTGLIVGARVAGVFSTTEKLKTPNMASLKAGTSKDLKSIADKTQQTLVSTAPKSNETTALVNPSSNLSNTKLPVGAGKGVNSLRNINTLPEHNGSVIIQDKPTIKAVSKLSIDEDALTKEASHSLRVGK